MGLRAVFSGTRVCGLAAWLLVPAGFLAADDVMSPPPGGAPLFPSDVVSTLQFSAAPDSGEKGMVAVEGLPFDHAVEVHTRQRPAYPWDIQLVGKIPAAVRKGDVLWMTLWARATETSSESGEAFSELCVEKSSPPNEKLGEYAFSAGKTWRQFAWNCVAYRDFAPGEAQICLRAGYAPQVIQIGGVQVLDFGTALKPSDLPHSKNTYPGMEADAPWRKAAAERIEKYRKADVKVVVMDATGQPVAGATVRIEQQRHAFGFGSCVIPALIEGTGPDSDRYREIIKTSYSKVVIENDLKWGMWDGSAGEGHRTVLAALQWLHDQGIAVRGHNLVWPSWKFTPASLAAFKNDPVALERHIESHIGDEVGATKGQLTEWDVVNEPFDNHEILDLLAPDAMVSWFKLVHRIDPQPVLYLNDFAGLTERGEDTPHKQAFEKTLRALKDGGAPIGGLGIQAHFGTQFTAPGQLLKELDRWAALGLDIQITEFDLNVDDDAAQAQYTHDFMTAVFSHPSVTALLTWGFWEGADWKPQAALYRKDWSIKPNGQAWNDLVLKEWHTDLTAPTDATGTVATRGFMGQYQVTVTYHGVSKTWPLTLGKEGALLSATLPAGGN